MKKNIILLIFLAFTNIIANDISTYEIMFDELKTRREGLDQKQIFLLKDPFNFISEKKDSKKPNQEFVKYKLTGILSNKAKINGNWYFVNEQIDDYKIIGIKESSVMLRDKDKILELKLNEGNKNVKITYK
ncbi:hypothetical protein CBLAS_0814 [Campylobacter blaseri]|uniref:Transformation system protein n=1 Tax=Campylobacter blaseri TaxID=2042961 RepID=A0A2P8R2H5_9BACT|nr:hypothetical protein [Campylobacter blaseri]PSM52700.1 hypothetical protein CQ405_02930 [Campylobacter blaseri]PSM54348.1 hypothetical protein CRN67_02930 [Campylobacter blaseri]QKF86001.1 hypothetical protein CBLAS_0814 [Campylobacter blaseri]